MGNSEKMLLPAIDVEERALTWPFNPTARHY
jgi:hypothetical protein